MRVLKTCQNFGRSFRGKVTERSANILKDISKEGKIMGTLLGLMVAIAILYGIPRLVQRHNQQIIHELWERQKKAELRAEEEKQKRLWDEDKKKNLETESDSQ